MINPRISIFSKKVITTDTEKSAEVGGQVDSPESPETPEIIKFYKSDEILNQTKRNINKLCLGKISLQKTVRIKFFIDSGFSNELCRKQQKLGNPGNQQKAF